MLMFCTRRSSVDKFPNQGEGALVRRSIGSMKLRNLTPFLMLDHFHVSKGAVRLVYGSDPCWRLN